MSKKRKLSEVGEVSSQAVAIGPHSGLEAVVMKLARLDDTTTSGFAVLATKFEALTESIHGLNHPLVASGPSGRVVLDVGGTLFTTTRSTLLRFPGTYFSGLLGEGGLGRPEADGSYFIDRDPEGFDMVLNYLRDGDIDLDCLDSTPRLKAKVLGLMEYFLIPSPLPAKCWLAEKCDPRIIIKGNKLRFPSDCKSSMKTAYHELTATEFNSFKLKLARFPQEEELDFALYIGLQCIDPDVEDEGGGFGCIGLDEFCMADGALSKQGDYCGPALAEGQVVEIRIDKPSRTFRFFIDGADVGCVFDTTKVTEPLNVLVESNVDGLVVELLSWE